MEDAVRELFRRYEDTMAQALAGKADMEEVASLYAAEFIGAAPAGVRSGRNDDRFRQTLEEGYAYYRRIGTKGMRIRQVRLTPIDAHHCMAHVAWHATYARKDRADAQVDFDVHYLVQVIAGTAKVFGWVSGDEQALLKQRGIV